MRWPWVSREHYEEAIEAARRDLRRALDESNARYADLLEKYHEMANPAPAAPVVAAPVPVEPPSEISKVIREQASESGRYDHALAKHLRGYALQLKLQGRTDDEIVGELVKWQNTETMFAEQ